MGKKEITRREFLKTSSASLIGLGMGALLGGWFDLGDGVIAIAASEGYLVVDTKKCAGCMSCTLACSLVHEGEANPSLSRIQILQDPFLNYPKDLQLNQCRQCPSAPCAEVCPTKALHADKENGNVRNVDPRKCIGCQKCIEACPYTPSRMVWNFEKRHSQKCDLCANTPHWDEKGGPNGLQACRAICPMKAITFTQDIPVQADGAGYYTNLKTDAWKKLYW